MDPPARGMDPPAQGALAQALGFSDEELAANRAGRLAASQSAQMARIWASRSLSRRISLVAGLAAVTFVVLVRVVLAAHFSSRAAIGSWARNPIVIAALLLLALLMGLAVVRGRRSLDRLVAGRVSMTTGTAATRVRRARGHVPDPARAPPGDSDEPPIARTGHGPPIARTGHGPPIGGTGHGPPIGGTGYELTIGHVRFIVGSRAVLDAFADGQVYRAYYIGRGRMATLLSAEQDAAPPDAGPGQADAGPRQADDGT
jgi:hypothetical protein